MDVRRCYGCFDTNQLCLCPVSPGMRKPSSASQCVRQVTLEIPLMTSQRAQLGDDTPQTGSL